MCLVEIPAEYQTVSKRVLATPATTREEEIPAVYKTVRKRVMVKPPTTRTVEVPAEYETVRVQTVMKNAMVAKKRVPAEVRTVSRQTKVTEGRMEWKPILCETNVTPKVVSEIQTKLKARGHYDGPVDGILGRGTAAGIDSFQRAKGFSRSGLTLETLAQLGLRLE